mgnify:CR=1 FL=1
MVYVSLFNLLLLLRWWLQNALRQRRSFYLPLLIGLFLFSAFRFEVGCDWTGYLNQYWVQEGRTLEEALQTREPLWWGLIELQQRMGLSYPWMNVFSSAIFFFGVHVLARRQPDPLAFLVLLFPVLIIGMPMSGIRQGAAIGVMCLAFAAFIDRSLWRFVGWTVAAAAFHGSAAIFLLLAPLVWGRYSIARLAIAAILAIPGAFLLAGTGDAEMAMSRYVDSGLDAAGAAFRVGALALSGAFFLLLLRGTWERSFPQDFKLAMLGSLLMVACLLVLPVSSVIADRVAYYLILIQAMIFARIPFLPLRANRTLYVTAPYVGLLLLLVVWAALSELFAACYLPYRTWIFGFPEEMRWTF